MHLLSSRDDDATAWSAVIASCLRDGGVRRVHALVGGEVLPLLESLGSAGIECARAFHEQGCGFAADAESRASGERAVVVVPAGPATLNLLTAMATAAADGSDVLVLSVAHQHGERSGAVHYVRDQGAALAGVADQRLRPQSVDELTEVLARACQMALPGVLVLEIVPDLLRAPLRSDGTGKVGPIIEEQDAALSAVAEELIGELSKARRPLLLVGPDAAGSPDLSDLMRSVGGVWAHTAAGRRHAVPRLSNAVGSVLHLPELTQAISAADLVVQVGAAPGESDFWDSELRSAQRLLTLHRYPGGALSGRIHERFWRVSDRRLLHAVLADVRTHLAGRQWPVQRQEWTTQQSARITRAAEDATGRWGTVLDTLLVAGGFDQAESPGYLVCDSARVVFEGVLTHRAATCTARLVYPAGFSPLGFAVGACVGVRAAAPDRPVVGIIGDGGLLMALSELPMLREAGAGVVLLVSLNGVYGSIRDQWGGTGRLADMTVLPEVDLELLCTSFGLTYQHCPTAQVLAAAVTRGMHSGSASVLGVPEVFAA